MQPVQALWVMTGPAELACKQLAGRFEKWEGTCKDPALAGCPLASCASNSASAACSARDSTGSRYASVCAARSGCSQFRHSTCPRVQPSDRQRPC